MSDAAAGCRGRLVQQGTAAAAVAAQLLISIAVVPAVITLPARCRSLVALLLAASARAPCKQCGLFQQLTHTLRSVCPHFAERSAASTSDAGKITYNVVKARLGDLLYKLRCVHASRQGSRWRSSLLAACRFAGARAKLPSAAQARFKVQ